MSKAPYVSVGDKYKNYRNEVMIAHSEVDHAEARIASSLIEKWGIVAAMPDGEDSSGRAKLRLASPQEIVERACNAAELLTAEYRKRGWVTDLPNPYLAVESEAEA